MIVKIGSKLENFVAVAPLIAALKGEIIYRIYNFLDLNNSLKVLSEITICAVQQIVWNLASLKPKRIKICLVILSPEIVIIIQVMKHFDKLAEVALGQHIMKICLRDH